MTFKIGDRVVINTIGFERYAGIENNPKGVVGSILTGGFGTYRVKWDNGMRNTYLEGTLSLAKPKMLENE